MLIGESQALIQKEWGKKLESREKYLSNLVFK